MNPEPTTEAGRALLADADDLPHELLGVRILAIEAEARASLRADLRAQAFGSPRAVPLAIIERILEEPMP